MEAVTAVLHGPQIKPSDRLSCDRRTDDRRWYKSPSGGKDLNDGPADENEYF
jgi:hypothetical protein